MVVCYGSTARPIHQAASWLPEVMHAKGPTVSPKKLHLRNQTRTVYFPLQRSLVFSTRASGGSPLSSRHQHVLLHLLYLPAQVRS